MCGSVSQRVRRREANRKAKRLGGVRAGQELQRIVPKLCRLVLSIRILRRTALPVWKARSELPMAPRDR